MSIQTRRTAKRLRGRNTPLSDKIKRAKREAVIPAAEQRRNRLAQLEDWIELANFFPPHDTLPIEPAKRLLDGIWKQWRGWTKRKRDTRLLWAHEIETNMHARLAANYLSKSAACEVYQLIRSVREALDAIADQFEEARARLEQKPSKADQLEDDEDTPPDDWQPLNLPPLIPLGCLNKDGGIDYDCGPFEDFLKLLKGIKVRKIRRCRNCERLFYGRADKWTCSLHCQRVFRVRKWRKKKKEYEANRRRNKKTGFKVRELTALSADLRKGVANTKDTEREPTFLKDAD